MSQFREHLQASQVIYGAALLLNDPEVVEYSAANTLPFLNMAIYELNDHLVEANVAITNQVAPILTVNVGENYVVNLPLYLAEIQEVAERQVGTNGGFNPLPRREFPDPSPATSSLKFWCWQNQRIIFNPEGANVPMEVQVKYLNVPLKVATDENSIIGTTNATMYLMYRLAALLAMFVGENQTRAAVLNEEAEKSLERMVGISNKGRQQISTRHRPFRASFKTRSW
jgi:hypothetical protein